MCLWEAVIRTILKGATPEERAKAAEQVCLTIDRSRLTEEGRMAAEEILPILAEDACELVRRALAVTLKSSPAVPRHIALKLARDVDSIALPILSASPAFTEEDLAEIVRIGGPARQVVIAKRSHVTPVVSESIVDHGVQRAIEALCANDNAEIPERCLQRVVERYSRSESVLSAVAYRRTLPMPVTEKLVRLVSDAVLDHLVSHHEIPPDIAVAIALGAYERATIDLVDQAGLTGDPARFVAHLNKHDRLTPSLLLRALANGHMAFLEHGLAERAEVPHRRARLMIHDAGPLGLRAVYEKAQLPVRLYPAFRAGVDAWRALEAEGGPLDRNRLQTLMLERFLSSDAVEFNVLQEDLVYLLARLDRQLGLDTAELAQSA
ncbi:hypothetical protein HYN04_05240 [Phenylobacterium parvum]|uniref:DUF2336 domain-containing protein n=1 Tax=Phenylobacterium parvum TaxID=2201350 RepID=A0A2Z3I0B6_9CAUL|nr:hypothetical protein HYN04_05240 [Phenylobacterium parvum]